MLPLLRYTLDLFASTAQPEVSVVAAPHVGTAGSTEPPARAIDPVRFLHPQANREVCIQDAVVGFSFSRAKRRTIGFSIGPEGLVVRAPRWTPLVEVEAALQEKGPWILAKLQEAYARQQRQADAHIVWQDGALIPYLGSALQLVLGPAGKSRDCGAALCESVPVGDAVALPRLMLGLAPGASAQQIRDAAQAWLMRQAQQNFVQRLDHYAPLLGVKWKKMRLSNAATRWGSASADGSVRLNWHLIHFSQPVIDYVVAHELSHLRCMNHSPQFWATVASVIPDFAHWRRQLKQDGIPQW